MKYLLAILISLSIFSPALAAKTVQGTVPHPPPLQPPVAGVGPNYSQNVESSGRTLPDQTGNQGLKQGSGVAPSPAQPAPVGAVPNSPSKNNYLIIFLIGLVVLVGAVLFWLRRRKPAQ